MKKISFFILFTILVICWSTFSVSIAAPLAILSKQAKFPSVSYQKITVRKLRQQINLGKINDISLVKQRPDSPIYTLAAQNSVRKKISSKSAIIIDAQTSRTLFSKQPDIQRQPASTIKILTGLIAIKSLDNSELISVSRRASNMPRSKVYLDTQKKYKADDLINAVLIAKLRMQS